MYFDLRPHASQPFLFRQVGKGVEQSRGLGHSPRARVELAEEDDGYWLVAALTDEACLQAPMMRGSIGTPERLLVISASDCITSRTVRRS